MLVNLAASAMSCSVTPATFNFGNYQPLSALSVDSTSQIQIICDNEQAIQYTIKLNAGQNSKMNPREMLNNNTSPLIYNLFLDAGRSLVLGDGITAGTNAIVKQQLCTQSKPCLETIYGRIYGGQKNVHVGSYSDIISLTVDYQ